MTHSRSELGAIQAILAEQETSWAAGDAVGFSRHVAEDCIFTNIFGQTFVGHEGFEKQHARIFGSIYRNTVLKLTVEHLRFIRPDVASADLSVEVRAKDGSPLGPMRVEVLRTKLNQLFVQFQGKWMITSYHNVDVKPAPPVT